MDVMSISGRDQQVGIRGLNAYQSNTLLVMIDGRSVYVDLYGSVFWDLFSICLDDIDRIEIVKSPASSLYGANAFNGVINIITTQSPEDESLTVHLRGGNRTAAASVLYRNRSHQLWYKVSSEVDHLREWPDSLNQGTSAFKCNGTIGIDPAEDKSLSLSFGTVHADNRNLFSGFEIGTSTIDGSMSHVSLNGKLKSLSLRTSFSNLHARISDLKGYADILGDTYDLDCELDHSLNLGARHTLIWGLQYKLNTISEDLYFAQARAHNLFAFFVEDEWALTPRLKLTLGTRWDTHPMVGNHLSPRVSLFFKPQVHHVFRFSISKAYRNPSLFNSYVQLQGVSTNNPYQWPIEFRIEGNQNLKSEEVIAYELGYFTRAGKGCIFNLNLFYKSYSHFIGTIPEILYAPVQPGAPPVPVRMTSRFDNLGGAWSLGGEASLDVTLSRALSGFGKYAYQQVVAAEDNPTTPSRNEKNQMDPRYPRHKINAGLRFSAKPFTSQILFGWTSSTIQPYQDSFAVGMDLHLPAYALVNMRVGWALGSRGTELYLLCANLLNNRHYEFPGHLMDRHEGGLPIGTQILLGIRIAP